MKAKNVEIKIPVDLITKVDKMRKSTKWYAAMPFSDYLQMLILRAIDYERQRVEELKDISNNNDGTFILFPDGKN